VWIASESGEMSVVEVMDGTYGRPADRTSGAGRKAASGRRVI